MNTVKRIKEGFVIKYPGGIVAAYQWHSNWHKECVQLGHFFNKYTRQNTVLRPYETTQVHVTEEDN
jgi:hypothetical protein